MSLSQSFILLRAGTKNFIQQEDTNPNNPSWYSMPHGTRISLEDSKCLLTFSHM